MGGRGSRSALTPKHGTRPQLRAAQNSSYADTATEVEKGVYQTADGYTMLDPNASYEQRQRVMDSDGETRKWASDLDPDAREALGLYTFNMDEPINAYLRTGGATVPYGSYTKADVEAAIPKMEEALDGFDLKQPMVFHRLSTNELIKGASTVEEVRAMIGQEVSDPGFMSTAVQMGRNLERQLTWGDIDADWAVRYHIKAPSGKGVGAYIDGIRKNALTENEFLFNKGARLVVEGAYTTRRQTPFGRGPEQLHVNLRWVGRK